jgi:hypothetical protein
MFRRVSRHSPLAFGLVSGRNIDFRSPAARDTQFLPPKHGDGRANSSVRIARLLDSNKTGCGVSSGGSGAANSAMQGPGRACTRTATSTEV